MVFRYNLERGWSDVDGPPARMRHAQRLIGLKGEGAVTGCHS
jgi:hypothetical protein